MQQMDLLETDAARTLLDQLLADSRLYRTGKDYQALLDFVIRLSKDYSDRHTWIKMLRVQMEQGDHAYKDFQVYGSAWNVSSPTSQRKG